MSQRKNCNTLRTACTPTPVTRVCCVHTSFNAREANNEVSLETALVLSNVGYEISKTGKLVTYRKLQSVSNEKIFEKASHTHHNHNLTLS